jgi:hypothetical protein
MATVHVVEQGDHISLIAEKYGFVNYRAIWDDPANQELRKQRTSPNLLLPGDRLVIPEQGLRTVTCETGKRHEFRLVAAMPKLRIIVRDFDNQPMPNVNCEVEVEGKTQKLDTDETGLLECKIPRSARQGTLRIPTLGTEVPLLIGHLDPPDSETGWKARLRNLGYWNAPPDGGEESPERLRDSIQEFQCDFGLKVTGEPDSATLAKLAELHGC